MLKRNFKLIEREDRERMRSIVEFLSGNLPDENVSLHPYNVGERLLENEIYRKKLSEV